MPESMSGLAGRSAISAVNFERRVRVSKEVKRKTADLDATTLCYSHSASRSAWANTGRSDSSVRREEVRTW